MPLDTTQETTITVHTSDIPCTWRQAQSFVANRIPFTELSQYEVGERDGVFFLPESCVNDLQEMHAWVKEHRVNVHLFCRVKWETRRFGIDRDFLGYAFHMPILTQYVLFKLTWMPLGGLPQI